MNMVYIIPATVFVIGLFVTLISKQDDRDLTMRDIGIITMIGSIFLAFQLRCAMAGVYFNPLAPY